MSDPYLQFLETKALIDPPTGIASPDDLPSSMFEFQADIARWALRRGVGIELKPSYFRQAVANFAELDHERGAATLFDAIEAAA